MNQRGKYVIVGILSVAVCAAAFAAWYQYRNQRRAHDFWGTTTAVLIAEAPEVEVLLLGEPASGDQLDDVPSDEAAGGDEPTKTRKLEYGDFVWRVVSGKEGKSARGIKNIRQALVVDTTFDWQSPKGDEEPQWQYALGFTDRKNWATVLFDLETGRVALTGGRKTALLDPQVSKELREFFTEQFDGSSGQPAGGAPEAPSDKPADETRAPAAEEPGEGATAPPVSAPGDAPSESSKQE